MKKALVYSVDVKLDSHGVVQESQCECGAGMGPNAHCKHVMLTLLAVTKTKEGIITKDTCTQQLQTFHHAKKYSGSPVKTESLSLRSDGSLQYLKDFDPRPLSLRNTEDYPHNFRNVWLNSTTPNLAIRQLYAPANIYGVCCDHDYLKETPEDSFLQDFGVRNLASDEKARIEQRTRGQSTNKHWLQERTKRLHASNFSKICKATDRTNLEMYADSLTKIKQFTSAATSHGKLYEATALKEYTEATSNSIQQTGIVVSSTMPYLACSPDGLVGDRGIVEVKCPYAAKDMAVSEKTVPYLHLVNENLTLKPNDSYYFQVQGTLFCTERQWCDFVVWTKVDIKIIRVQRDESFIKEMLNKLDDFFVTFFKPCLLRNFLYKKTDKLLFKY